MERSKTYITDKTGGHFFVEFCGEDFKDSAIRNLQRDLISANEHPKLYAFLDLETAKIVTEIID